MKKYFLIAIAFSITTSDAWSQAGHTKNELAVQQTVFKTFEALSNRDSVGLKMYCSKDVKLYENGAIWNLDTLIRKAILLNKATDFKRKNSIDFISTRINKKTAWVTYNNQADITMNSKHNTIRWLETVVLVKEKKNWKIILLHSTLIKKS